MKNSILKIIACLYALLLFANCSKDDTPSDTPNTENTDYYFTAKVEGTEDFEVNGFVFASDISFSETTTSIITGATYEDESRSIAMGFTNINGPGTYTLFDPSIHDPDTSSYVSSLIYGEDDTGWYALSFFNNVTATVTITEFNEGSITGTFNFTGFDIDSDTKKNITDGQFKVKRL